MAKNEAAAELARGKWANVRKAERSAHGRRMANARWAKRDAPRAPGGEAPGRGHSKAVSRARGIPRVWLKAFIKGEVEGGATEGEALERAVREWFGEKLEEGE